MDRPLRPPRRRYRIVGDDGDDDGGGCVRRDASRDGSCGSRCGGPEAWSRRWAVTIAIPCRWARERKTRSRAARAAPIDAAFRDDDRDGRRRRA